MERRRRPALEVFAYAVTPDARRHRRRLQRHPRHDRSRATGPGELTTLASERAPIRLGRGTFVRGALEPRTIDAAVHSFSRFRKLFEEHHVSHYRAVATSALRNASNRELLLDRLFHELGIELQVIDGAEEARLVSKAVAQRLTGRKSPEIIVDLGGGSLEVLSGANAEPAIASMRIGTVRMLDTFGIKGPLGESEARMIRRFVAATLRTSLASELYEREIDGAAICGGNAEAWATLFGSRDKSDVWNLSLAQIEKHLPALLAADVKKRMSVYGVRKDRAEVMGIAGLVFATLGKELGIENFVVPGVGIREGILLDLAEASVGELARTREPPTLAAARTFAARIGHDVSHGEQVRRIAAQLFVQLKELHGLSDRLGTVLELAALLHDVGEVVHRKGHHRHSEYLIREGRIPGLDGTDRELVAAVARAHRKSMPRAPAHATFAALDDKEQRHVRLLSAILRLADSLDTDHRQRILAVSAEARGKKLLISISVERGHGVPAPDPRKALALEEVLGRRCILSFKEVASKARRHRRSE